MIKLDSTRYSVVVLCTDCPWWFGFADTRDQGWRVGAAHEERTHTDRYQARNALSGRRSRARHAV